MALEFTEKHEKSGGKGEGQHKLNRHLYCKF